MRCREIIEILEQDYPKGCAEEWDNVGLLAGDENAEIKSILVALDATDETIEQAVSGGFDMLITHHPLIFGSVKQINNDSIIGRRLLKLIGNNITYYAMHTNFDIKGMARLNEEQIGLVNTSVLYKIGEDNGKAEGIGRVGELKSPMKYEQLAEHVKKSFKIESVRCYGSCSEDIKKVAISGGAGKSVVCEAIKAGARVLITGDIDYHTGIDAAAQGLYIIDAGHFGTEKIFMDCMTESLSKLLPKCRIEKAEQTPPFVTL